MKKISLALALLLIFSLLASCNEGDTPPEVTTTVATTTAAATTTGSTTTAVTTTAATTTAVTTPLDSRYSFDQDIKVIASGRTIYPLSALSSTMTYNPDSDTVYAADYSVDFFSDKTIVHLPEINVLTNISISVLNGGTIKGIAVYNENFKSVNSRVSSPNFITELDKGKYYVVFNVIHQGDYVPSHSVYEETSHLYAFCVLKK